MVLCCALVGVKAAAFSVQVRKRDLVNRLKDKIKKTFASKILCNASSELQLYPARTNNAWLSSDDEAVLQLGNRHVDASIEARISAGPMDATSHHLVEPVKLRQTFFIGEQPSLPPATTLPDPQSVANECTSLVNGETGVVHEIPLIWEFMKPLGGCTKTGEILWRLKNKQVTCILLDGWLSESPEYYDRRSILVGSPGAGKSTLILSKIDQQDCLVYMGYENGQVRYFTVQNCYDVKSVKKTYAELCEQHGLSDVWVFLNGFEYS